MRSPRRDSQFRWSGRPGRGHGAAHRTAALYHLADTLHGDPPTPGRLAQLAAA